MITACTFYRVKLRTVAYEILLASVCFFDRWLLFITKHNKLKLMTRNHTVTRRYYSVYDTIMADVHAL